MLKLRKWNIEQGVRRLKIKGAEVWAFWLVVLGALNWGLVGVVNFNLVEGLLSSWPVLVQVVYVLVGISGLWLLWDRLGSK